MTKHAPGCGDLELRQEVNESLQNMGALSLTGAAKRLGPAV
jgi:hypothetical protein